MLKAVVVAKQFKPDFVQFTDVLTKVDLLPAQHKKAKLFHDGTKHTVRRKN